ncbi:hypothetical protein QF002_008849 [Paraburkholderia youngii]
MQLEPMQNGGSARARCRRGVRRVATQLDAPG